jgi:hypothetical protein
MHPIISHVGTEGGVEAHLYSFFHLGARWGQVIYATPHKPYPGNDPVPTV